MESGYLTDTNTIIDYLENKLPEKSINLIDHIDIQLSVITRIELLVWPKATKQQLEVMNNFIKLSRVFDLDEPVILKTVDIRKEYRLKLPDAIVAATAIVNNLILLTRNISDFERISELKTWNPYNLHF